MFILSFLYSSAGWEAPIKEASLLRTSKPTSTNFLFDTPVGYPNTGGNFSIGSCSRP